MTFDEIFSTVSQLAEQNRVALSSAGDTSADLHITGESGGIIGAAIKNGVPAIIKGSVGSPEATVAISADDFASLLAGKLNPMLAVMTGRIKVSGNYAKLMGLIKGLKG